MSCLHAFDTHTVLLCIYVCLLPETVYEKRQQMKLLPLSFTPCHSFWILGCHWSCVRLLSSECRSTMSSCREKFLLCPTFPPVNCREFVQSRSRVSESGPIMSACLCQIVYTWLHMCVCEDMEGGLNCARECVCTGSLFYFGCKCAYRFIFYCVCVCVPLTTLQILSPSSPSSTHPSLPPSRLPSLYPGGFSRAHD